MTQPSSTPPERVRRTFRPAERLRRQKIIGELIASRRHATIAVHPLRWIWKPLGTDAPAGAPAQIAFSVSKRRFRRAVQRNRLKRLMRQAWREHKHLVYQHLTATGQRLAIVAIWQGNEPQPYTKVHQCTAVLTARLIRQLQSESDTTRLPTPLPPKPPQ